VLHSVPKKDCRLCILGFSFLFTSCNILLHFLLFVALLFVLLFVSDFNSLRKLNNNESVTILVSLLLRFLQGDGGKTLEFEI